MPSLLRSRPCLSTDGLDRRKQSNLDAFALRKNIMFWPPRSDVPLHKAEVLVRTHRELKALTDQDLIDREYIVKAVRGALTGRVTHSDAANSAIAEALKQNTAELVRVLDEVVVRAVRQCATELPPDPIAALP